MKKLNKNNVKGIVATVTIASYSLLLNAQTTFAETTTKADTISDKLNTAATTVQTILTSLVVVVGICASLFIIIKRLPDADDPREKSEVYKGVGRIAGMVALAAAVVWVLPWVYTLFT